MKIQAASLALATAAATTALAADDAAIARCRGIADNAGRLACYDALPVSSAFRAATPAAPPAAPAATPAPPAARAAAPAPAAPPAAQAFGMEERIARDEQPKTMESAIAGHFGGWGPRERIRLANGQVWQVVDDSTAYLNLDNPKVVIRRGMMGGFFLEVENTTRTARVRRIQ